MNPLENLPQEIAELIVEKNFEQLNKAQKSLVLSVLSEEEYQNLRMLQIKLIEAEKLDEKKVVKTPKALLNAFDQKHTRTSTISMLFQKQVPTWQMAASAILFFGLGFMLKRVEVKVPENQIVYKNTIDTVYQIKTIIDTIKIEKWLEPKTKIVFIESQKANYARYDNTIPETVPGTNIFTTNDLNNTAKINSSLAYDSISSKIGFVTL